eukprot:TRINITY_DN5283_c0_g1_i1.p1 TRINITY_DN5283_c0_g1~~TRINITY_DN5283_c0_g1_i1.p1  ORF type:complete len:193 (-),score=26.65 TRINITY_DN5283_c0_g1_i1:217-795(-)
MGAPPLDPPAGITNEEHPNEFYEPISTDDQTQSDNSVESHHSAPASDLPNGNGIITTNGNGSSASPSVCSSENIISYQGMDIHVFGNLNGLENLLQSMSSANNEDKGSEEDEEEEKEEERRREESERAIREAERADFERRNAPLEPDRRSAILDAMRGISISNGFRPSWADSIPEHQWINQIRTSRQFPGHS